MTTAIKFVLWTLLISVCAIVNLDTYERFQIRPKDFSLFWSVTGTVLFLALAIMLHFSLTRKHNDSQQSGGAAC